MITAIIKILTTIEQAAQECLDQLGEGARPDAEQIESFFALNNTPVAGQYCRVVVAPHIATALQYMLDSGITSEHVEIIRVEWMGQDMTEVEVDDYEVTLEDGSTMIVHDLEEHPDAVATGSKSILIERTPFQVGTQDVTDEEGNVIDQQPVYLGRMV
jgi:hypothetical protein